MKPIGTIDELAYIAPPRIAIRALTLVAKLERIQRTCLAIIDRRRRAWSVAITWFAAGAFVLAYLLICSYLERHDLSLKNLEAARANAELQRDKESLEAQLAEAVATRTQKLIYLIEADTSVEARDKLQRLAMLISSEHFNLQEAIRETKK